MNDVHCCAWMAAGPLYVQPLPALYGFRRSVHLALGPLNSFHGQHCPRQHPLSCRSSSCGPDSDLVATAINASTDGLLCCAMLGIQGSPLANDAVNG